MIRYFQLTHAEATSKTETKSLQDWIDLECMIAGISLEACPEKPILVGAQYDAVVFQYCDLNFTSREAAAELEAKIMELVPHMVEMDQRWDSKKRHIVGPHDANQYGHPTIKPLDCYTKETYEKIKASIEENERKWKEYVEASARWKERQEHINIIGDRVASWFQLHLDIAAMRDQYNTTIERYRTMADGDMDVALRFFNANEAYRFVLEGKSMLPVFRGEVSVEAFVESVKVWEAEEQKECN